MAKLKIYDFSLSRDQVMAKRDALYFSMPPKEKLERLFSLISVSITLNNGKPLKIPQGKGLIIYRKKK